MKQHKGAEKIKNDMVSPSNNVSECHFVLVEDTKNWKGRIRAPLRNTILHIMSDLGERSEHMLFAWNQRGDAAIPKSCEIDKAKRRIQQHSLIREEKSIDGKRKCISSSLFKERMKGL